VLVPSIKLADYRSTSILDLLEGGCTQRLSITVRLSNRGRNIGGDIGCDLDRLDDFAEQRGQLLLTNVDVATCALAPSAAVVHVLALLSLGRHRAAAKPAFEQAEPYRDRGRANYVSQATAACS